MDNKIVKEFEIREWKISSEIYGEGFTIGDSVLNSIKVDAENINIINTDDCLGKNVRVTIEILPDKVVLTV